MCHHFLRYLLIHCQCLVRLLGIEQSPPKGVAHGVVVRILKVQPVQFVEHLAGSAVFHHRHAVVQGIRYAVGLQCAQSIVIESCLAVVAA